MASGVYIHIPFCAYKCHFCDFATALRDKDFHKEYALTVTKEIKSRLSDLPEKPDVHTIFYGGGTPGLFETENLELIHRTLAENINLLPDNEISLETNPENVTIEKAKFWQQLGINRLSIGVQSFSDKELSLLGRGHSAKEASEAVEIASNAGFENINCDLMYGLPSQDLLLWQNSVSCFIQLSQQFPALKHLSAYGLELSNNAPLVKLIPNVGSNYPNEDVFEKQLRFLYSTLKEANFIQYEISNFAKSGYESKHNLNYWQPGEYHAFGVSAHRYIKPYRSANWRSLPKYMEDPTGNESCEFIDNEIAKTEAIMLGLRKSQGLNIRDFNVRYGINLINTHRSLIENLISNNLLIHEQGNIKLTIPGQMLSNTIIAEFLA